MIAAWMAYAVVVSTVFGLAGMALERSLRLARRPARWSVAAAILGSILIPAATREAPMPVPGDSVRVVLADPIGSAVSRIQALPSPADLGVLDRPLLAFWIVGATFALCIVIGTQVKVAQEARSCPEGVVRGVRVRRTRAFGPATVGCLRSVIVLPEWVDRLDAGSQRVVVLHEAEHVRARDPQLLFAALILTALQPWNVALWWQLMRLRAAIELDCDQRMLSAGVHVRAYGDLLLRLALSQKRSLATALAFAASSGFVGRRIRTMADHTTRTEHFRAAVAALFAAALALVGCETPSPIATAESGSLEAVAEPPAADADLRAGRASRPSNAEYAVAADGLEEVLEYLRDAGVSRALIDGNDAEGQLEPIIADLRDRGVLRAVPSSQDPLNVFFEDSSGAPQGLLRVWVENGQRRVQLFRAITVRESD